MNLKFQISNFKFFIWWLRQVLGDSAYENYLRSVTHASAGAQHTAPVVAPPRRDLGVRELAPALPSAQLAAPVRILSREEFFLDSLRRRYSSISRCC